MEGPQRPLPPPTMSPPACTQLSLILVPLGPASMGAHVPVPMTMCPITALALRPSRARTVAQVRRPRGAQEWSHPGGLGEQLLGPGWGGWCLPGGGGDPHGCCGSTVWFAEKCFDETRYEYFEVGDHWARVSKAQVEQCSCTEGQTRCEGTHHTGMPRYPVRAQGKA